MVKILTEELTLEHAQTKSMARFGDGELRVANGQSCLGQRQPDAKLANELRSILQNRDKNVLVCIPHFGVGPNRFNWDRYNAKPFASFYNQVSVYGSAFVTRPDSAPWIDTPAYWARVRDLWRGKDIVLVWGAEKSLTPDYLKEAALVREVRCSPVEAWAEIDMIESQVERSIPGGTKGARVLICAGVMGTVLAARLARKGIHALDLGHIGMFMKRYERIAHVKTSHLISDEYLAANKALHDGPEGFGGSGYKHAQEVARLAAAYKPKDILDYGCGEGTLAKWLTKNAHKNEPPIKPLKTPIIQFDPAIPKRSRLPKPADLVVCTDVLEHVEPDRLDAVLSHLCNLTNKAAYLVVATRPANKTMPDGSNAHRIIENAEWWMNRIKTQPWKMVRFEDVGKKDRPHEVRVWLEK